MKNFIIILIVFYVSSSLSKEIKKGDTLGTVIQTETEQRLKEFPNTTLQDHAKTLKAQELAKDKNSTVLDPRLISWGFRVTYLGDTREISGARKKILEMLASVSRPLSEAYVNEVFVSDGTDKFWLPIQSTMFNDFKNEIKKGDLFEVKTRYFANYFEEKPTPYFIMIDFKQIPKAPPIN